jgi:hypothetical protein
METPGGGILGRLAERIAGWIALALLVMLGVAIWRMEPATRAAIWSDIWRTAVWIVIAAGLPWSARLFIKRILEVGSNWAAAILLASLVAANLVAGLILMRGWPSGGWGWIAALATLAVAGTYNYLVTEYLAQQKGG